jgi:hypothetical protein
MVDPARTAFVDDPFASRAASSSSLRPFDLGEEALDRVVLDPNDLTIALSPVLVAMVAPWTGWRQPCHRGETLAPGRVG